MCLSDLISLVSAPDQGQDQQADTATLDQAGRKIRHVAKMRKELAYGTNSHPGQNEQISILFHSYN